MSAVALSPASETDFSSLVKPEKAGESVAFISNTAILVKPKIGEPGEASLKSATVPNNISSLQTMAPRRHVVSPRIRSTFTIEAQEFKKIRKYDGVIIKRGENSFWARLQEKPLQFPAIEAEFELNQLTESDRPLAVEGTSIIWTLGFGRTRGTWMRESIVYIRRLLPPQLEELKKSQVEVQEMMNVITWE